MPAFSLPIYVHVLILISLSVLAVAVVLIVRNQARLNMLERFERFHKIMGQLANQEGTIASRLAALHELEHHQEYADLLEQALSRAYPPQEEATRLQKALRRKLDDRARRSKKKASE